MIGGYFVYKHGMETDEKLWGGQGGIISDIKKVFDIPRGTEIAPILRAVIMCHESGEKYDGATITKKTGRIPIMSIHSQEGTIAGNNVERGVGKPLICMMINDHRREAEKPAVTQSAVDGLISRLKPERKAINKRPQGSYDVLSRICRARYLWGLQTSIRSKVKGSVQWVKDYCKSYNKKHNLPADHIPKYLQVGEENAEGAGTDFCTPFKKEEVTFFDETHRKACPGTADGTSVALLNNKKYVFQVPKDKNGKFDPDNGEIEEKNISQAYVKYMDEGRFCLGVCIDKVIDDDGSEKFVGRRLPLYDYTGKILLSPTDFDALIMKEIERVKNLKCGGKWLEKTTAEEVKHKLYSDDPVTKLSGIGKVASGLLHCYDIYFISDLLNLKSEEDIDDVDAIPKTKLKKWIALAKKELESRPADEMIRPTTTITDHRQAENPYKSKYGQDDWLDHMKQTSQFSSYADIRDMVRHIVAVTKAAGKKYFYHDALSLMTCKKTMEWMEEEGILEMWIRPQAGLFEDDEELKRFWGRVVGNSPELMPLDKRLNKDIHESVNQHYVLTNDLPKEDPRRFGLETPRQVARSYARIWDPDTGVAPSPERIAHDFLQVFDDALPRIVEGKGICLDDNKIAGRRHAKGKKKNEKWGGPRKRKLALDNYGTYVLHQDARHGIKVKLEKGKRDFERVAAKELEADKEQKEQEAERAAIKRVSETQRDTLGTDDIGILGESMADALGYEIVVSDEGGDEEVVLFDRDAEIIDVEES